MNLFIDSCTGDWYTSRLVPIYPYISYIIIYLLFLFLFYIKAH